MGCGASSDLEADLMACRRRLHELETKNHEQQNLLRFKIEVLVNMLSVEEQRNEVNTQRIDTLKWLLYSQGVTEEMLSSIVSKLEHPEDLTTSERQSILTSARLLDMQGAMQRMAAEFELHKEEIVRALATEEGKVLPTLPAEQFMRAVYSVTEHVSKADLRLVALRFDDGQGGTLLGECLSFFSTPPELRRARTAVTAVRASLDLLELDVELDTVLGEGEEEGEGAEGGPDGGAGAEGGEGEEGGVDRGGRKLLLMWGVVRESLARAFAQQNALEDEGEGKVSRREGERILREVCGERSRALSLAVREGRAVLKGPRQEREEKGKENTPPKKEGPGADAGAGEAGGKGGAKEGEKKEEGKGEGAEGGEKKAEPPLLEPLSQGEVELLVERFELSNSFYFTQFLNFFSSLSLRYEKGGQGGRYRGEGLGVSPLRYSRGDWQALRESRRDRARESREGLKGEGRGEGKAFTAPKRVDSTPPLSKPAPAAPAPSLPPTSAPAPPLATPPVAEGKEGEEKKEEKEGEKKAEAPPVPAPAPPKRGLFSFLCGGKKAPPAPNPPEPLPAEAKGEAKGEEKPGEKDRDRASSLSLDETDDGERGDVKLKRDELFSTPLKPQGGRGKKVSLALDPEDNVPFKQGERRDFLQREELGLGTAAGEKGGSRFRRRTTSAEEPPRSRLSEESDEEGGESWGVRRPAGRK